MAAVAADPKASVLKPKEPTSPTMVVTAGPPHSPINEQANTTNAIAAATKATSILRVGTKTPSQGHRWTVRRRCQARPTYVCVRHHSANPATLYARRRADGGFR